jgi:hypothetical protein
MTEIIANDGERPWDAEGQGWVAEQEWDDTGDGTHAPNTPSHWPDYSERRTATASWQRSILIITGLSVLCWAAVILFVIALLSAF